MSTHPPTTKQTQGVPNGSADGFELQTVQGSQKESTEPSLPLEDDIMQAARIGALEIIQKGIDSKKFSASYRDEEGITPLHWAAINNQYATCKYLLEHGADVNAQGGESHATAAMWAAQRCHFYIVNLMIEHGVDLQIADAQGYNVLHLATIDGNVLLVILLLLHSIPVDTPDPQGHTSLMWAAYKGWPAIVDLLLRWSADVRACDSAGFTPLHWALVKGSRPCLEKLLEYGADRFAKTNDGKMPFDIAAEMNSKGPYVRALDAQGYMPDGQPKQLPLGLSSYTRNSRYISKFFFLFPFLCLFICFGIISHTFSIYLGMPLALAAGIGLQKLATYVGTYGPSQYHDMHKTPFLTGIFSGTLFWVFMDYLYNILPATFSTNPIANLAFFMTFTACTYFYYISMTSDPGYVPLLSSRAQQRALVSELFSQWAFNEDTFCVQCLVRRPLRSKHCRRCGRCVAKHDHHCPWINTCVAVNNLRQFYLYIVTMAVGIVLFTRLVFAYLANTIPASKTPIKCNLLPTDLCPFVEKDTFTICITLWSLLQLVWLSMLIAVQSLQIAKNVTTYESMKRHQHGHEPTLPTHNLPVTLGPGSTSLNDTAASATRVQARPDTWWQRLKKTLGIDVFLTAAGDASKGKIQDNRGNPFSRGMVGNCVDFWRDPAPLLKRRADGEGYLDGEVVDYYHMYERPRLLGRRSGGMRYERVAHEEEEIS